MLSGNCKHWCLQANTQKSVSFIVNQGTATLSRREPALAAKSQDSCDIQLGNKKRRALLFYDRKRRVSPLCLQQCEYDVKKVLATCSLAFLFRSKQSCRLAVVALRVRYAENTNWLTSIFEDRSRRNNNAMPALPNLFACRVGTLPIIQFHAALLKSAWMLRCVDVSDERTTSIFSRC